MTENNGWIGVDLDGTLAFYDEWRGEEHIGEPIVPMLNRVKGWLAQGIEVRIFTARANTASKIPFIKAWLVKHGLPELEVTATKDYGMIILFDDRACQVVQNTGMLVGEPLRINEPSKHVK